MGTLEMNDRSVSPSSGSSIHGSWYWSPLAYTAFALAAPYYLVRMSTGAKYRAGLRQRLTLFTPEEIQRLQSGPFVWVHAVSVGELMAARPLLRRLKQEFPFYKILVTTVTETGQELAQRAEEVDEAVYLPLDLFPLCRRMMNWIRPACLLIVETELWPNLIRAAIQNGVPVYLINARLSDRSFRNYRRYRFAFRPLLTGFSGILAQSEEDRRRFAQIGAPSEILRSMGNLKFEAAPQTDGGLRDEWRRRFQIQDEEILLLGGSTFPGEELELARVLIALRNEGIPLRLLIAPRHIERADAIVEELRSFGVPLVRRSQWDGNGAIDSHAIILLDTIGELRSVYAAADLVFVGKSLHGQGGQNPIEPAAWGRPILFGENMQNFRDIAALFLRAEAAESVASGEALLAACRVLCQSPERRAAIGRKAQQVVMENRGALDRVIETLQPVLRKEGANE